MRLLHQGSNLQQLYLFFVAIFVKKKIKINTTQYNTIEVSIENKGSSKKKNTRD